jgi:hypothetical protein
VEERRRVCASRSGDRRARAGIFIDATAVTGPTTAGLVGLCDLSRTRMDWHNRRLAAKGLEPHPTYLADAF